MKGPRKSLPPRSHERSDTKSSEGQTLQQRATPLAVPGLLALVGGLMMSGGSFLDWFGATSVGIAAVSVAGTEGWQGRLTAACGFAAVVIGVLTLAGRVRPGSGALLTVAALGIVVLAVAAFSAATAHDRLVDAATARIAASSGVDAARARAVVERAFGLSEVTVSVEAGVFVVLGGGALVTAAGIIPWLSSRARRASPPSASQASQQRGANDEPGAPR